MQRPSRAKAATQKPLNWFLASVIFIAAALLLFSLASAQTQKSELHSFRVVTVTDGLNHPWGMAFLPGGDVLITERNGGVRLVRQGKLVKEPVEGAPKAVQRGQGGLLGVAVHPKFAENRLVYIAYSGAGDGGVNTEVARAKFNGSALEGLEVIFRASPKTGGTAHYGGRLAFTPDGHLLITLGDRYSRMRDAQTVDSHIGKVIRVRDDGSAPEDNPFAGKAGAKPEIYSYGHRNVQGVALRPGTDQIWTAEFGPQGGDEVNLTRPGANYGWPAITYGVDYGGGVISDKKSAPGMEQPVAYWVPSISPSGITFYDGDKFPQWRGNLFVAALSGHIRRLTLSGDKIVGQEELLARERERFRDVAQGPDGNLYALTDDDGGKLIRIEPAN